MAVHVLDILKILCGVTKHKGQCVKWVASVVHTRICHYLCGGLTLF